MSVIEVSEEEWEAIKIIAGHISNNLLLRGTPVFEFNFYKVAKDILLNLKLKGYIKEADNGRNKKTTSDSHGR